MELPPIEELELPILSVFARAKRQGRDRRTEGMTQVDPRTGLPISSNDLLPASRAVTGEKLAMQLRVEPEVWATAFMALTHKPKHLWTDDEAFTRSELEMRIKKCVRRMAERGWFNERYPSEWDGTPTALAADGYCCRAAITGAGLIAAEEKCRGTKWETGPVSILHGAPEDVINAAPAHAQSLYRSER